MSEKCKQSAITLNGIEWWYSKFSFYLVSSVLILIIVDTNNNIE